MSNIEQLSVKQLIEKQGLTVHQLRTTLARLEKQGYGSLPVVLAADDEMNKQREAGERMKPNSIEKLKQAENFMNAAAGLLDSVVSVEWESLAEGDYKTEECIDEMESISNALRKQRASVMKLVMDQSFRQVAEERPSTMRFLEDN